MELRWTGILDPVASKKEHALRLRVIAEHLHHSRIADCGGGGGNTEQHHCDECSPEWILHDGCGRAPTLTIQSEAS
ncbi:MAG: hypothetical protein AB8H86_15825 [Polyangiales bacterium]